ncbi:hypothetical protein FRACA_980017 [Frankia canadensis]|uniref:AMP-dependent synthetase/ligase domain-containing protein n=1 Tax=Frankia canadensis TaxID=1836972 RepID=A0A2I2L2W1_9ACTN|nr:AMP-binding protein [Frankia canadensis]SNQ52254.1 hypothetical protein FRACA_980017 [Frankia canadensis]SOU59544.1 hypothetical protein FRACA_980017 [Frankia canadensis]
MLLLGEALAAAAADRGSHPAVTQGSACLRFDELDERANRTANALAGLGVGHGDVLAVWAPTSLRLVELFAGAARLGAVFAPLSPALSAAEAGPILDYLAPGSSSPTPSGWRASTPSTTCPGR